jgi:hypothetical protein
MDGWLVTRKGPYQRPRITWESAHKLLGETCWWPHSAEEASSRFSIRVKEAAVLLQVPHSTLSSKLNENEVVPIKRLGRFTLLRPVDLPMIRKWMENTVPIPKQLSPEAQVVHSVEAAHLLGVVHSLVYYWIKRGMLSARRSGNGSRLYVSKEAVLQLKQVFDEHRAKHISPPNGSKEAIQMSSAPCLACRLSGVVPRSVDPWPDCSLAPFSHHPKGAASDGIDKQIIRLHLLPQP